MLLILPVYSFLRDREMQQGLVRNRNHGKLGERPTNIANYAVSLCVVVSRKRTAFLLSASTLLRLLYPLWRLWICFQWKICCGFSTRLLCMHAMLSKYWPLGYFSVTLNGLLISPNCTVQKINFPDFCHHCDGITRFPPSPCRIYIYTYMNSLSF